MHIGCWHPETSTTELSWVMSYVKSSRQAIYVAIFLKWSLVVCSLSERAWARSRPIKFARLQSRPRPSTRVAQNNFFQKFCRGSRNLNDIGLAPQDIIGLEIRLSRLFSRQFRNLYSGVMMFLSLVVTKGTKTRSKPRQPSRVVGQLGRPLSLCFDRVLVGHLSSRLKVSSSALVI